MEKDCDKKTSTKKTSDAPGRATGVFESVTQSFSIPREIEELKDMIIALVKREAIWLEERRRLIQKVETEIGLRDAFVKNYRGHLFLAVNVLNKIHAAGPRGMTKKWELEAGELVEQLSKWLNSHGPGEAAGDEHS